MKFSALFPKQVLRELDKLAGDLREESIEFDAHEPWHRAALVLVWLVREVVKLREEVVKLREARE